MAGTRYALPTSRLDAGAPSTIEVIGTRYALPPIWCPLTDLVDRTLKNLDQMKDLVAALRVAVAELVRTSRSEPCAAGVALCRRLAQLPTHSRDRPDHHPDFGGDLFVGHFAELSEGAFRPRARLG